MHIVVKVGRREVQNFLYLVLIYIFTYLFYKIAKTVGI